MVGLRCAIALLIVFISSNNYVFSEHLGKVADKFPLKSYVTRYGDIIDCVDIYDQLAFRNPLLKDHKLQRKPTDAPGIGAKSSWSSVKEMMALKDSDRCHDGTVPVRRVATQEYISSEYRLEGFNPKTKRSVFRRAIVGIQSPPENSFYGVSASISTQNPPAFTSQMTAGIIGLRGGPKNDRNAIYVGWTVYPELYHDSLPHFSTYWKGYNNTGCYDLLCSGFVQSNPAIPLGAVLFNTSVYGGVQWDLAIRIIQDRDTLNWWLYTSDISVGYWPRELFTYLDEGASDLLFGGTVKNKPGIPYPLMGYGFLPNDNIYKSAYVTNIQYIGSDRLLVAPSKDMSFKYEDSPKCYRILNLGPTSIGYTITYGGHGGPDCPVI